MTREQEITKLYKEILNRSPDESGLTNYVNSNLTIDQIRRIIESSPEANSIFKVKGGSDNKETKVGSSQESQLLVMGASPKIEEHIQKLKEADIEAVLCLDSEVEYDTGWVKSFLQVPIDDGCPINEDSLRKCIEFIYVNVIKKSRKTFIHSEKGSSRAPMMIALFLTIEKGVSFMAAVTAVMRQRPGIEPDRGLVDSKTLRLCLELRKKYGRNDGGMVAATQQEDLKGKPVLLKVSNDLFMGTDINNNVLVALSKSEVKSVIDLNVKKLEVRSITGYNYRTIHIPVQENSLTVLMPIVVKNIKKCMSRGPVYICCSDRAVLGAVFDIMAADSSSNGQISSSDRNKVHAELGV